MWLDGICHVTLLGTHRVVGLNDRRERNWGQVDGNWEREYVEEQETGEF